MSKYRQSTLGSDVYALIRDSRMNDAERRTAVEAMRKAEAIADAVLWIQGKIAAVGQFFLKPSLKH